MENIVIGIEGTVGAGKTSISRVLLEKIDNRFELVIVVAKRARQISGGQNPLTRTRERSAVTLAANEIAEGKVKEC